MSQPQDFSSPYASPQASSELPSINPAGGLGSLSQAARGKQLNSARNILLFIGILTVIVNLAFMAFAKESVKSAIKAEVDKLARQGLMVDGTALREAEETAIRTTYLIMGAAVALGVVFIVLALLVHSYPVPVTILALVLYIGAAAVFGLLDPMTLLQGIIIKIFIVIGLVSAVRTAFAYERERAQAATASAVGY